MKSRGTQPRPEWALTLHRRRSELNKSQEAVAAEARMSQSYYSEVERGARDPRTLTLHKLARLARALGWDLAELQEHTGLDLGLEERLPANPGAQPYLPGIRLPVYGTVGAGLKAIRASSEPEDYRSFDMAELPKGAETAKLFILRVNGDSMSDENVLRSIPHGSHVLVECDVVPRDGQIVVAWIPELETGVLKQYFSRGEDVLLRSYNPGGPTFWASRYPDMIIEGVVRRVIWEPR
ncbi:SOS-response transcriptional repressor LexA [Deinobacterium chartae]|uniref:SOS-response transcriptional repressor LexA n=1 Tax=Deinobacterium chartae TaxID=521158 RepID=A0A841I637_9DEIO|nr:LexA family transcriptional regulator [Deinobacterium chartae]MBB6099382.1 SOS-response transcriptional repressor LexA [Deinobacterium chartae]